MASLTLPNVPTPKNGMIKTYENTGRTFTRPYSAKTIFFYKKNDDYFQGVRVPVSKARYRTMDSLMDDLSEKVPLYFGVRRLYTPMGRREIQSIEDLHHMGSYVCSSWAAQKWAHKPLELRNGRRGLLFRRTRSHDETIVQSPNSVFKERERLQRIVKTNTAPSVSPQATKQILFAMNGKPNKVYRMQFKLKRLPEFENVLQEVSDMLQMNVAKLFTNEGVRVTSVDEIIKGPAQLIACHKYERPLIENGSKLPPIGPMPVRRRFAPLNTPPNQNPVSQLPPLSPTNDEKIKKNVRRRTLSTNKRKKAKKIKTEAVSEENETQKESNAEPILLEKFEMEWAVLQMQAIYRASKRWKRFVNKIKIRRRIDGLDQELAEKSAVKIQSTYKGFRQRKKYHVAKEAKAKIDQIDAGVANESATKIQSLYRGYRVRKSYKRPKTPAPIWTPVDNTVDFAQQEEAAIKIQAAYRGHAVRKKKKEIELNNNSLTAIKAAIKIQSWFRGYATRKRLRGSTTKYNVSVSIGNRWGANSDAELYIHLGGSDTENNKILLDKADPTTVNEPNLVTYHIETETVEDLKEIIIGHSSSGYGAGLFIAEVTITEDGPFEKMYNFPCLQWFDSGQVDGKIERRLMCKRYSKVGLRKKQSAETNQKTRYKITMYFGEVQSSSPDAQANVYLICFGDKLTADPVCVIDNLSTAFSNLSHSFEIDATNLGDLYKLRFESRTINQNSDLMWWLNYVDLKKINANEGIRTYCYKNFCSVASKDAEIKSQIFRELPITRNGFLHGTAMHDYKISLNMSNNLLSANLPTKIMVQLNGEFGESGPCIVEVDKFDEVITTFVESAFLGRLSSITCTVPVDQKGEYLSEGLSVINDLYEKHGLSDLENEEWLISKIVVRESDHTPYHYIFAKHRSIESTVPGYVNRHILLSAMEGLSTKFSHGTTFDGPWTLSIVSTDETMLQPMYELCLIVYGDGNQNGQTNLLSFDDKKLEPNSVCDFKTDLNDNGTLYKIRLVLQYPQNENQTWTVSNVKMKQDLVGTEINFMTEFVFDRNNCETYMEWPIVWPDVPPLPIVVYQLSFHTGVQSLNDTDFFITVIIYGEQGDTGKRYMTKPIGTQLESCFKPGNVDSFVLEQVSVNRIEKIFIRMEPKEELSSWHMDQNAKPKKMLSSWFLQFLELYDRESSTLYNFDCKKWFSETKEGEKLEHEFSPYEIIGNGEN